MSGEFGVGEAIRSEFPIFEQKIFCDTCAKGALSLKVRAAVHAYLESWQRVGSPWGLWMEKVEELRVSFAAMIGASPEEVAVVPSVSAALSSVATGLAYVDRPKVVVTESEFPTVLQTWHAQGRLGAEVEHVAVQGDEIGLREIQEAVDDETVVVSSTHVCYRDGSKLPISRLVELCHARGAYVMVDAYQSVGTAPINVRDWDVDFLTTGCLKYLLGSSGMAFLYVRGDLIGQLQPTCTGWHARSDPFDPSIEDVDYASTARRFQGGTPAMVSVYAALAGLSIIRKVGLERIERHIAMLTRRLIEGSLEMGLDLMTPLEPSRRGPLVVIRCVNGAHLVQRLADRGIIVSSRGEGLRVSFHLYNTAEDVEQILSAFRQERAMLATRDA